MCGLAASVVTKGLSGRLRSSLPLVANNLTHRGPDSRDHGVVSLGQFEVGYVHTRLAIIDPTNAGDQPFRSRDGRFMLLFNGEVFNYLELKRQLQLEGFAFNTDSDTEVLLNAWIAWGPSCLPRIIGMFAFIIVDFASSRITACRDSFGIKPLYWSIGGDHLSFASEISAVSEISGLPLKLNHQVAHDYVAFGSYDRDAETFLEGVFSLLPGHLIEVDLSRARRSHLVKRWFQSVREVEDCISLESAIEQTRHEVIESVKLHLRSDVPVGVALSGGIDSSVIAAAARLAGAEGGLKSFSFSSGDDRTDESARAATTARLLGTDHTTVRLSDSEISVQLDREIISQGEPFGTMSVFAQSAVYRSARAAGVPVMLDGQGGDEVFAGYDGYLEYRIRSLLSRHLVGAAASLVTEVLRQRIVSSPTLSIRLLDSFVSLAARGRLVSALRPYRGQSVIRSREAREGFGIKTGGRDGCRFDPNSLHGSRHLTQRLGYAVNGGDLGNLLRHADRSSMSWSVESRLPYLNRNLVKIAHRLPERFLLSDLAETKYVLRRAFADLLPREILSTRRKIGFEAPDARWIRALGDTRLVGLSALSELGWAKRRQAQKIVTDVVEGRQEDVSLAWRLMNLSRWIELISVKL